MSNNYYNVINPNIKFMDNNYERHEDPLITTKNYWKNFSQFIQKSSPEFIISLQSGGDPNDIKHVKLNSSYNGSKFKYTVKYYKGDINKNELDNVLSMYSSKQNGGAKKTHRSKKYKKMVKKHVKKYYKKNDDSEEYSENSDDNNFDDLDDLSSESEHSIYSQASKRKYSENLQSRGTSPLTYMNASYSPSVYTNRASTILPSLYYPPSFGIKTSVNIPTDIEVMSDSIGISSYIPAWNVYGSSGLSQVQLDILKTLYGNKEKEPEIDAGKIIAYLLKLNGGVALAGRAAAAGGAYLAIGINPHVEAILRALQAAGFDTSP